VAADWVAEVDLGLELDPELDLVDLVAPLARVLAGELASAPAGLAPAPAVLAPARVVLALVGQDLAVVRVLELELAEAGLGLVAALAQAELEPEAGLSHPVSG